ncbi:hypothetical protein ACFX11_030383 [Malus domestica]
MINHEFLLLFRRLQNLTPFKPKTILQPRRTFCAKSPANANNGNVPETSVSSYHEQYKQLEKLDFMTATKCSSLLSLRKLNLGSISIWYNCSFVACLPWPCVWGLSMLAMKLQEWKRNWRRKRRKKQQKQKTN